MSLPTSLPTSLLDSPEFKTVTITLYPNFIRIERPALWIGALKVWDNFLLEDFIDSPQHAIEVIQNTLKRLDAPF